MEIQACGVGGEDGSGLVVVEIVRWYCKWSNIL
jgi:hypothetical protein